MPALDQLCQPVAVVPVEHVSPREVVSDLLTASQGWERRERTLTHLLLVDVVILRCLLPRHWLQAVYGHLTRATGWLRATGADGGGLVLPASHAGHRCAAAAGPARLPPTGQRPDHRRLCLWAAADGHRQDAGRCAGHPGQRGLLWPGGQWAQRQSLPFPSLPAGALPVSGGSGDPWAGQRAGCALPGKPASSLQRAAALQQRRHAGAAGARPVLWGHL